MIDPHPDYRIEQPMAKPAFVFVLLALGGLFTPTGILIGAVVIVGLDLILPWKVIQR